MKEQTQTVTPGNTAREQPRSPLPLHWRASSIGLVFLGGTLGTAAREGISLAWPSATFPAAIMTINVVGAFLLGLLMEVLVRHGSDTGSARALRLAAGTGFMGGFTTYSTFAVGVAQLIDGGNTGLGIGYGLATVLVGALAALAGIALGAWTHRRIAGVEARA